ncbi:MAG: alpha/beta hydrolase [Nitrospinaceae bacterium]|nr:alpha/beta hydrolase [Nitrospinaceae bacterium]
MTVNAGRNKRFFQLRSLWVSVRTAVRSPVFKAAFYGVILMMFIRWFEHSQVYRPSRKHERLPESLGRPFEDFFLKSSDGVRLHAWFFPVESEAELSKRVILFSHGNAGNISHRLDTYEMYLSHGINLLAYDYRGYGKSEGRPGEEETYADLAVAYDWLITKGFQGRDILLVGESLGGGISSELPLRKEVGGLLLLSSFSSVLDIGKDMFPWLPVRWINQIRYDTIGKLPGIEVPVMIMHSREDRLIGYDHAERNFMAANEPKKMWDIRGDHNETLQVSREEYSRGFAEFLKMVEGNP